MAEEFKKYGELEPRRLRLLQVTRLSPEVLAQTQAIDEIAEVRGWLCGNAQGAILFAAVPPALDQRTLNLVAEQIAQLLDGARAAQQEPTNEIEMQYKATHLIARRVGNAWFAVWSNTQADLALLRLTLSVAAPVLENDRLIQNAVP